MSKILIVEDEDAIRRVLKKVLSEENEKFVIDEAADGCLLYTSDAADE